MKGPNAGASEDAGISRAQVGQAVGYLFAGAAIGASVALLYAPQNGARTTRDLKKFARDTAGRLNTLQEDVREQVACCVTSVTDAVKDGVARGERLSAEGYDQVLHAFDSAKKCVEDGRTLVEEIIKPAAM